VSQKYLKAVRVEVREFEKETLPRGWFPCSVEIITLKGILHPPHGLNPSQGEATALDRQ
jgi:hypothetical protein